MWIFKLLGVALLLISGLVLSRMLNRTVTAALRQNEGMMALLRRVRGQIECFSRPIGEILSGCEDTELAACGYEGKECPLDLAALLVQVAVYDVPTVETMTRFAEEFGRGYREDEVRACDYALSLLDARRAVLQDEMPQKKKRNTVLSVCASLALALLLL